MQIDEGGWGMRTASVNAILGKAVAGERLTFDEGVALFECNDLHALGRAAHAVCHRLHPEPYRTYNIDRNINYTNVCAAVCDFCAFYRKSGDSDAYVLPREVLYQKIEETIALGDLSASIKPLQQPIELKEYGLRKP